MAAMMVTTMPATASAMTYRYNIIANYCYGPANSYVYFEVKMIKPRGLSPAMLFTINGKAQHTNVLGGSWKNEWNYGRAEQMLPGGAARFTWSQGYWREPEDTYRWHRIHLVLRVWTIDGVLAKKTLNSVAC
jgi:hypothetical protein